MPDEIEKVYGSEKLSREEVKWLRKNASPQNIAELAQKYEVVPLTIVNAVTGKTYRHVDEEVPPIKLGRKQRKDGLSPASKEKIKLLSQEGVSNTEISRRFGISLTYVNLIIKGLR